MHLVGSVDIGTMSEQRLNHLLVALLRRNPQRRAQPLHPSSHSPTHVSGEPTSQHRPHHPLLTRSAGRRGGRVFTHLVARFGVSTVGKQHLH